MPRGGQKKMRANGEGTVRISGATPAHNGLDGEVDSTGDSTRGTTNRVRTEGTWLSLKSSICSGWKNI
jgi:hypothetical protein